MHSASKRKWNQPADTFGIPLQDINMIHAVPACPDIYGQTTAGTVILLLLKTEEGTLGYDHCQTYNDN